MNFIRPEAAAALMRWREAFVGVLVLASGAWWSFGLGGLMSWIGAVAMLAGTALVVLGIQRGRFRAPGGGPGLVRVDEGQITYFGPLTGGAVALADLDRIELDRGGVPVHWCLFQTGQPSLAIPVTAEGAELLFDAFASLPGFRTGRMLTELNRAGTDRTVIWQRRMPPGLTAEGT